MRETFLCAKYDYKMDIVVKQEEAFQDGKEAGITEGISLGTQQKAIEAAIIAVKDFNVMPEIAAEKMNAPLELVLEALGK